jgi:hypothetical protein
MQSDLLFCAQNLNLQAMNLGGSLIMNLLSAKYWLWFGGDIGELT